MGGAGGSSTAAFFIGTSNQIYTASPLPLPTEIQPTQTGVLSGFGVFDIAIEGTGNSTGDIWVATDQATSPIRSYTSTGVLKNAISLVSSPRGLAYFSSGGVRYLWASSANGQIYLIRIDNTGIEGSEGAPIGLALTASENPFNGMTTLAGTGFSPGAVLEIFDVSGRKVVETPFQDTFDWSGASVPAGVYAVRVTDPTGAEARLSITRL